jgi:type IV secretion system protein VirD4
MTIWDGAPGGFARDERPISYNADDDGSGNAPSLLLGTPGTGKTVQVCNELLDEPGERSYIVTDFKGEIYKITSDYRRRVSEVKVICPYGTLGIKSDQWNPLNDLDPDDELTFGDDAQGKGNALIKTTGSENSPFFPDAARSAVTGGMMDEALEADEQRRPRSLAKVRSVFSLEHERLRPIIERMVKSEDPDIAPRVAKFLDANRETEAIKSTIETQMAWMTAPMRKDMLTADGVDFRECRKRPMTIYVILPVSELQSKSAYLRLLFSTALRSLYRQQDGVPVTLMIDEAFVLGHYEELEIAASILRGFGCRLCVAFQSYGQILKLYPQTHGLFTAGAIVSFRPADLETAEWLVKRAGKEIVPVLSAADPSSPSDMGVKPSWQQKERDRIPLHKMMGMPRGRALVWKPHEDAPRMSWMKGYFDIPQLKAKAGDNPFYRRRR